MGIRHSEVLSKPGSRACNTSTEESGQEEEEGEFGHNLGLWRESRGGEGSRGEGRGEKGAGEERKGGERRGEKKKRKGKGGKGGEEENGVV